MIAAGSSLSDWLKWLETLSPNEIELGLDRVRTVFDRLSPRQPEHVLLVAGTNGKGSSVAMLSSLLRASGRTIGVYTSPHISHYNERIAIDGSPAPDKDIIAAFEEIEAVRDGVPLTYFEFGTLAAMRVFERASVDVWILEVGMGGRLDATNAIEPTASLITNVSLDHCGWLGEDIESIAYEKAGVMRRGVPTVYAASDVPNAILRHAQDSGARLLLAGRDFSHKREAAGYWGWTGMGQRFESMPEPGLHGDFQLQNAAGVLALLFSTGLGDALTAELLNDVLPGLELTGRLQSATAGGANWLLDVAHNPAAAAALATTLEDNVGVTWGIIGLLDDKDVEGIVEPLNDRVSHWIAVTADSHRALAAEECARRIANHGNRPCMIGESLRDAMDYARHHAAGSNRILITGSFYLVGPALQILELYSRPES